MSSCNQRSNQRFMHAFHPGACKARLPGAFCYEEDEALHPIRNNKARTEESEEAQIIHMDIPGVKGNRVSIEEKNGEIEITAVRVDAEGQVSKIYQEILYVNPFRSDIENSRATVSNGVLTLTIPKNEKSTKTLEVESSSIPSDLPSDIFRYSTDLPGVAASGLEVEMTHDTVQLRGKRIIGDKRILVERSFEVPPSMDTNQARALMQDGVFTFLAPIHKNEEDAPLRTILVEDGMEIEPAVAGLKIGDDDDNNGMNQVETVDVEEDRNGGSWEQIQSQKDT
eukprot:scaffold1727_cov133-Cylindrotheca_fusiformis.AAC.31